MKRSMVLLVALLLAGLVEASAQSLADVAKKEKERRKALGNQKVETYDDSSLGGRGRIVVSPPTTAPADAGEEGTEAEEEEDPTETQSYWRDRKAAIDKRIADAKAQLNRPGFASDPDNLMRRNQIERQLAQARSDLAALQAEARRKGIPPGWVR